MYLSTQPLSPDIIVSYLHVQPGLITIKQRMQTNVVEVAMEMSLPKLPKLIINFHFEHQTVGRRRSPL